MEVIGSCCVCNCAGYEFAYEDDQLYARLVTDNSIGDWKEATTSYDDEDVLVDGNVICKAYEIMRRI